MNKTIKRNVVISAILAIMLCVSLIAGATFALFTSESKVNIAVTSGKVDVVASLDEASLTLYSPTSIDYDTHEIKDADNAATETFKNGGTAVIDGNTLTLTNVTPGDKATVKVIVTNNSNVTIQYRTILACESDNGLFSGLNVTIAGEKYEGETRVSKWANIVPDNNPVAEFEVVVELPSTAGNEYQGKTMTLSYQVEAVQGNAATEDPDSSIYYIYNAFDWMGFVKQANEGTLDPVINTVKLMKDVDLQGIEYGAYALTISGDSTFTIDGNKHTIKNLNTSAIRDDETGDSFRGSGLFAKVVGVWGEYNHKLVIKDLTVDNATVAPTYREWNSCAAVLVGETYAVNEIEFNNCSVVNSSVTSGAYAGAFIGYDYAFSLTNQKITVVGGSVKGSTFNGNDATAALIAINYTPTTISGTEISGNTVNGGSGYSAAALVGTAFGSFSATDVTLANNTFTMNEGNTNYKGDHKDIGYFFNGGTYVVNGVPYVTTLEQFTAAVNGTYETVVLAADITNETVPQNAGQIAYTYTLNGKTLTIDLAGHTFTTAVNAFNVTFSSTLTLESSSPNGRILFNKTYENSNYVTKAVGIFVYNSSTLNICDNVVLEANVFVDGVVKTELDSATINMNGGEIIVYNSYAYMATCGTFNMNGGKITLKSVTEDGFSTAFFLNGVKLNLNGGTVEGTGYVYENRLASTITQGNNFSFNTTKGLEAPKSSHKL